ncbi:MAG: squalene--hopene cyclase [Planctomycetaceae bacterium]
MQPPPPPPRRLPPAAHGRSTLVGGLPWSEPAAADTAPGMPVVVSSDAGRARRATRVGPVRAGLRVFASRLDDLVRRSPPFTVSLSVHVLVLLALALSVVRAESRKRLALELAFGVDSPAPPTAEVSIAPAVAPQPVPEPVPVVTPEPVVPDPVASPPEIVDATAPGPEAAEPVAPSVRALLSGREEGRREALVEAAGGNGQTEVAVGKALAWLAKCQGKDGFWSLQGVYADPARQENRLAATAMALLAFQGAGHTPTSGSHAATVQKAWKALAARQLDDGRFEVPPDVPHLHRMYSHAQATIAACELAGMTGDAGHGAVARRAIAYAVAAQGPNGGWRYGPGEPGDMSVTGWYVMALKSGEMAGLDVPAETFRGVDAFLDGVALDGGSRYGYMRYVRDRPPADDTSAVSAEGLLARQFLGWRRDDERLAAGIRRLLDENLPKLRAWGAKDGYDEKDVYAWYYLTQVVHHVGGQPWRQWNAAMREVLPRMQVQSGREAGSWDPALDHWGSAGGRLFETCFCTWMLEVYYRHLPLYGEEALVAPAGP